LSTNVFYFSDMLLQKLLPGACNFTVRTQHNGSIHLLEQTMKLNPLVAIFALILSPAAAGAADVQKLSDPIDPLAFGKRLSIDDGGHPSLLPLREVLSQPVERLNGFLKPYRLSAEEREHMREQVRSQSSQALNHK
jgi:hypothetical protein